MLSFYELRKHDDRGSVVPAGHRVIKFPGDEMHVKMDGFTATTQIAFLQGADSDDLFALAMWVDGIKRSRIDLKTILVLPYLPAARMDRGVPFGAKVYADFINRLAIDNVVCLDPHSDVMPALLDNLTVVPLTKFIPPRIGLDAIIAPDVGARKRAEAVASLFALPVLQAEKHRDFATGALSGFACEGVDPNKRYLIVDDICDGGGTFLGLAKALGLPKDNLSLWVTHGIFSKGLNDLVDAFYWIGTTDSHPGTAERFLGSHVEAIPVLDKLVKDVTGGY